MIETGKLKIDFQRHLCWRGQEEVHLSPKEFDFLAFMMKHPDELLTHVKLLRTIWGLEYGRELEYLRTYVSMLRKKIEDDPAAELERLFRSEASGRHVILDLIDLTLANQDAINFLERC